MLYSRYIDPTIFPKHHKLRDNKTVVTVHKEGKVTAKCGDEPEVVIAEMTNDAPAFLIFMDFWTSVFSEEYFSSLAFNQLVVELMAGRLAQDPYNPFLFLDMTRPHGSIKNAFPLIEASRDMTMQDWNPDDFYANHAWALADNPRVKFYLIIRDFEGNDMPQGYAVGVTDIPGEKPEFQMDSLAWNQDELEAIAKPLLDRELTIPEHLQFAGYKNPFDGDDVPF